MRVNVLDHGFIDLRNIAGPTRRPGAMFDGDDTDPANSARMSFDMTDSGRTREEDLRLCGYLMKHWHTTPFEMLEVWIEMKMPIFVARQFVRHRTVTINEVSGRYITLPAEWYIPEVVGAKPDKAKQGQIAGLEPIKQEWFKVTLNGNCQRSYDDYLQAIRAGIAPEHARMMLHLNHFTHWLWKQDIHNMMHFLSLRDHSHAQVESQMYAKAIDGALREYLPNTMKLYDEYRRME